VERNRKAGQNPPSFVAPIEEEEEEMNFAMFPVDMSVTV